MTNDCFNCESELKVQAYWFYFYKNSKEPTKAKLVNKYGFCAHCFLTQFGSLDENFSSNVNKTNSQTICYFCVSCHHSMSLPDDDEFITITKEDSIAYLLCKKCSHEIVGQNFFT